MNPSINEPTTGILLVGHGTRDRAGQSQFEQLAAQVLTRCQPRPAAACYLELVEPDIAEGVRRLVEQGAERIVVVPAMLFAAGHVLHDIPEAVGAALAGHPHVTFTLTEPLACHPRVLALSQARFDAAIAKAPSAAALDDTLLLIVGRGSSDAQANAELARFARLRWEMSRVGWVATCYVAATHPALAEGLAVAAALGFANVVVQPHLLFSGQVLDTIVAAVAEAAGKHAGKQWLVAEPLGPDSLVVDALVDRLDAVTGELPKLR